MVTQQRSAARRAALTKSAEYAAMDNAFIQGFCKAAETLGVDPAELYKAAAFGDTGRGAALYDKLSQPENVAAGLTGLAGAGLLGYGLLPGEGKTRERRIAGGVAGAGLLGGATYLATNHAARQATRKAILKLFGRAAESLG